LPKGKKRDTEITLGVGTKGAVVVAVAAAGEEDGKRVALVEEIEDGEEEEEGIGEKSYAAKI